MKNDASTGAFALIAGSARCVIGPRALLPAWLWVLAASAAAWLAPAGGEPWAQAAVLILGFFPLGAWISSISVRAAARARPLGLAAVRVHVRRALRPLGLSVLFTILTPVLLLAVALAVSIVGQIPWVGRWLLAGWMLTGGLLLAILAAMWFLVGLPAALLQVAASVSEFPDAMEIASRTLSYVRRRPLQLTAGLLGSALSAVTSTAVFGALVSLVTAFLLAMSDIGGGERPELASISGRVWSAVSTAWTGKSVASWEHLPVTLIFAFFGACFLSGLARVYLILRRSVDGVPVEKLHEPN